MSRGGSSGGGQSSLGYLFGGDEPPKPAKTPAKSSPSNVAAATVTHENPATPAPAAAEPRQVPAGVQASNINNYHRSDGQNCGNFITERRSTKVHAAPGGGSSLDYLFGGGEN
ncbi:protein SPIRAL1-like 3 [Wolffia australiana]